MREDRTGQERGRESRRYFSAPHSNTYGVGRQQTPEPSARSALFLLSGTARARQAALLGDSPRGKFFGAYCLE